MKASSALRRVAAPFLLALISTMVLTSCGSSSSSSTTTPTPAANNSVAVVANFGPLGSTGGLVNGLYVTVTVCQHGTQTCIAIPNVAVDTDSVGLRILGSALGSVPLAAITSGSNQLQECVQFGDTSYAWGPMFAADVDIGGETASDIPVQILESNGLAAPATCLTTPVNSGIPNGGNLDSVISLGANGLLGIGNGSVDGPWDFGNYYVCPGGACEGPLQVSTSAQATNPVALFTSSDRNGVMIALPAVGATGATSVSGTMTFGINTQSDNSLGSAVVYAMDPCNNFPQVSFGGVAYQDTFCSSEGVDSGLGGFMDTGSNALYVSDATTLAPLGISDCASGTPGFGFYCVSGGTVTLSGVQLFSEVNSTTISLNIADGTTLVRTGNAVFNNVGSDSGTGPSNDYFDFGLPFFLGRTVFVGVTAACTVPGECTTTGTFASSAPYGFVAF